MWASKHQRIAVLAVLLLGLATALGMATSEGTITVCPEGCDFSSIQ